MPSPDLLTIRHRTEHRRLGTPGLLRTVEYAPALEAGGITRGKVTPAQADERVRLLPNRQESTLGRAGVHAVLRQSCLATQGGGQGLTVRRQGRGGCAPECSAPAGGDCENRCPITGARW
ncbi:Scr1 family TA system antitoxin-like transcriptional regulator [Kitasatospora sp. NPDC101801]|uniref:Scr1 family TA system antitoxin-like transcriptional regulator n=1 Tax=Kitasatospora sp. NPDC101801 TaxID=3364103 RepID=UPI0037F6C446